METNKKLEKLLDAVEHPEKYSDVDIEKILEDDECHDFYEIIVRMNRIYRKEIPVDIMTSLSEFKMKQKHFTLWKMIKIVALFICAFYFSCVSYSNIRSYRNNHEETSKYFRLPFHWGRNTDTNAVMLFFK